MPITARPRLMASFTTIPNGSGATDGNTPKRARSHAAMTVACGIDSSTVTPGGKLAGVSVS